MGSMHTGLDNRARDTDRLAAYFAERARIFGCVNFNLDGTTGMDSDYGPFSSFEGVGQADTLR